MGTTAEGAFSVRDPGACSYCGQETRSFCDDCQRYVCLKDECQDAHGEECGLEVER